MLSVINGTIETQLDDGTLALLAGHDGWGMAPARRLNRRGPLQHGVTDRGFRLDPRIGTLVFQLNTTDLGAMYEKRAAILALFKPQNNPKLKWTLPNGQVRQIDCFYNGDMTLGWDPNKWAAQRLAVSLTCPDPTFYDPNLVNLPFGISGGGTGWAIPWAIGWNIGQSTIDHAFGLTYQGTFESYPTIKIQGPLTNPIIRNETLGLKLDFTGVTLGVSDYYIVDCRYGYKTVVDQTGANKISTLTTDSDLTTFRIADDPEAPGGYNTLRVTGTGATAVTQVYIQFYTRYIGL